MNEDYGKEYEVTIRLNKEEVSLMDIPEFIRNSIGENVPVLKQDGHEVVIHWEVPENEGVHEIENELYYSLDDGRYGTYSCKVIR